MTKNIKRSNNHKIWKILLRVFGMLLSLVVMCLVVLIVIDKFFDGFRDTLLILIGNDDSHFAASDWFGIVAAIVSSLPGTFCGILALVQTQKLHQLENRYHRPMIEFLDMTIRCVSLNKFDMSASVSQLSPRQFQSVRALHNMGCEWYIDSKTSFFVKNEIGIKNLWVEDIIISMNGKSYSLYSDSTNNRTNREEELQCKWNVCDLKKDWVDGLLKYELKWRLDPSLYRNKNEQFEKDLLNFVYYMDKFNSDYEYMTVRMNIYIEYEYAESKLVLCQVYDAHQNNVSSYEMSNTTEKGYFTYDYH